MSVFSILQAKSFFDSKAISSAGAEPTVQILLPHMTAFIPRNSVYSARDGEVLCAPYHLGTSYGPKQKKAVFANSVPFSIHLAHLQPVLLRS